MIPDTQPDDWRRLLRATLNRLEAARPAAKLLDLAQQLQGPDPGPAWDDEEEGGGMESKAEVEPETEAEAEPEEERGPADADVESVTAHADGTPESSASPDTASSGRPDQKAVPPLRLHALARVCRTFGTPDRIRALVRPGALTLITCADPALLEDLPEALRALLRSVTGLDSCSAQEADAARTGYGLLTPRSGGDAISKGAREDVARVLRRALAMPLPLVVVLPSTASLDPDLRNLLPAPVPVRPLDAAVLGALLDETYRVEDASANATASDSKVACGPGHDCLAHDCRHACESVSVPEDPGLRRLSPEAIALVLRQPDRATALAELRRLLTAYTGECHITLDDVVDCGEAERVAWQLVRDLGAWSEGRIAWSAMTRSLLLHGQPGTGKTHLAHAIGGSAGVPVVTGSFAAWQAAGHLGHMLAEMGRSFAAAHAAAPCLLLLDEIDAAGSRDSPDRHAENYRRQVINGFLAEMDGMAGREGVIVVAACNDVAALDPAIIRPGRFDRIVEVPYPGPRGLRRILEVHAGDAFDADQLEGLVRDAVGCTPAEIEAAVREARSRARAADRTLVPEDLRAVLAERHGGDSRHLHRIAVHECGHALVALALGRGRILRLMAGPAGGEILIDRLPLDSTLPELEDQLALHLAGRVAEALVLGSPGAGAGGGPGSDLACATRLALRIELTLGLGSDSLLCHPDPDRALLIDPTVRVRVDRRLQRAAQRARAILAPCAAGLRATAERLAEARMLEGPELEAVLAETLGCAADGLATAVLELREDGGSLNGATAKSDITGPLPA